MNEKSISVELIQLGNEKTTEGIPKNLAVRFGGLEMTLHIDGLTSWDDGKPSDTQRKYLIEDLEDGQELVTVIQRIANRYKYRTN